MSNALLCLPCQTFLRGESIYHRNDECFSHHPNAESFKDALALPCAICNSLWASLQRGHEYFLDEAPEVAPTTYQRPRVRRQDLAHQSRVVVFEIGRYSAFLLLEPWEEKPHHYSTPISNSTGDNAAIEFLLTQYKRCLETHANCQLRSPENTFLPTRVIDVGIEGDALIHLRQSVHLNPSAPYIALSHCWGKSQPFILTQATLNELEGGLDTSRLPKTFQHAIAVTRKFNIRYLWIDSLCIFQDNLEDWHIEAGRMRDVYSKAVCCVAATASNSGDTGLFYDRDPRGLTPIKVEATWSYKQKVPAFPPPGPYWCGTHYITTYSSVDDAPLNQRAWVAQERYLSPRIMHFSWEVLFWECDEFIANECFPDGIPDITYSGGGNYNTRSLKELIRDIQVRQLDLQPEEGEDDAVHPRIFDLDGSYLDDVYRAWCTFRTAFTGYGMTKEKDAFIALCGIVQDLAIVSQDEFVAGLWKRRFLEDLAWKVTVLSLPQGAPHRPSKWRAPSWSWASTLLSVSQSPLVRGRQKYTHSRDMCTVQSFNVKTLPSGELENASVTIKSNIIPARLLTTGVWAGYITFPDTPGDTYSREDIQAQLDAPLSEDEDIECDVLLLFLRHFWNDTDVNEHLELLVIAPSQSKDGCFQRIAMFDTTYQTDHVARPSTHLVRRYEQGESMVVELI